MKRLLIALVLTGTLAFAGQAMALQKKVNIFNGAEYDIYTLYLSPTNANQWEENLLKEETLPNGDKVDLEVSRTEKAEAWDIKVTNKAGQSMTWIGVLCVFWWLTMRRRCGSISVDFPARWELPVSWPPMARRRLSLLKETVATISM